MTIVIAGIGTAVPSHRISQADALAAARSVFPGTEEQERLQDNLYLMAGVEARHGVVLDASDGDVSGRQSFFGAEHPTTLDRMQRYEQEAGAIAVAASGAALQDAGVAPERITHLITVSCSGFYAPGFDVTLIKRLGLPADVARTHVGFMGCHAAINGLRVAQAFLSADPSACVLLCAVELCTLHHQYAWDVERLIANALFADGAGAFVAVANGGAGAGKGDAYEIIATGSTLVDDSEDAMSWRIGNHGFVMTLSPRIPKLIRRCVRPWLDGWLARHGLSIEAVGSWAVHPGGPAILSAFSECSGLSRSALETSYGVLAEYGNMSSPTVLFILDRLRRAGAPRPCVAIAFGPGMAVEAALLA
jgi:predicted naringenin-chalcone synthase